MERFLPESCAALVLLRHLGDREDKTMEAAKSGLVANRSPGPHVPKPGVWCPAVTFFDPVNDEIDVEAQATFYHYLSHSGLTGLVVLGTNAETLL